LEPLSEYEFDIKHMKGKASRVDDALNRRVHEMHASSINMYVYDLNGIILEVVKSN